MQGLGSSNSDWVVGHGGGQGSCSISSTHSSYKGLQAEHSNCLGPCQTVTVVSSAELSDAQKSKQVVQSMHLAQKLQPPVWQHPRSAQAMLVSPRQRGQRKPAPRCEPRRPLLYQSRPLPVPCCVCVCALQPVKAEIQFRVQPAYYELASKITAELTQAINVGHSEYHV